MDNFLRSPTRICDAVLVRGMVQAVTEIKDVWPGFLGSLMSDVDDAMRRQRAENSPTMRRALIRALIATVEGLAWIYREHVLHIANEIDVLTEMEKAALSETLFTVDDTGRISEQRRFLSTVAAIRLTSRIARKFAPDAEPDFGGAGWVDLKETIALRNRITHPKGQTDLEISESDIDRAISAFHWFAEVVIDVLAASNHAFRNYAQALGEVTDLLKAGNVRTLERLREIREAQFRDLLDP